MIGSSLYTNIIGAILGIILLITVITALPSFLDDNVGYDPMLNDVIDELQQTKKLSDDTLRTVTISVPLGGAIVAMDDAPFMLNQTGFTADKAHRYQHIKGWYMERPPSCGDGTCVCLCEDIGFEDMSRDEYNETFDRVPSARLTDAKLRCQEPQCAEANVSLHPYMNMQSIFGPIDNYKTPPGESKTIGGYVGQYWSKSFLFLNSDHMRPEARINDSLLTIGGYAGKLRQSEYEVTMYPTSQGIKIAEIR